MSALFGSNAEATDQRIAGTDQSQIAVRRGTIVNPGGVAFGARSGNTTYKIGKGGSVSILNGLSGGDLSSLVNDVTTASAAQIDALKASLGGALESAQKQIGNLAKTAQQTPEDKQNKSVTWIALGALALVGLWVLNQD